MMERSISRKTKMDKVTARTHNYLMEKMKKTKV